MGTTALVLVFKQTSTSLNTGFVIIFNAVDQINILTFFAIMWQITAVRIAAQAFGSRPAESFRRSHFTD